MEVSLCTGINNPVSDAANVNIYPNPNMGQFTIDLGYVPAQPVIVDIMDALGQKVQSFEMISTTKQVDLSVYGSGVYTLRVINGNSISVYRVISNK